MAVLLFPVSLFGARTHSLIFLFQPSAKNYAPKIGYSARSAISRCPYQRLQLCGNARCTSLNIIFLTDCKFGNFLARIAAIFKIAFVFAQHPISFGLGALLSELNVKLRGAALLRRPSQLTGWTSSFRAASINNAFCLLRFSARPG